jgi:hypothetical protein
LLKVITALSHQISVLQTLADNASTSFQESTAISVFALIQTERLLVEIMEQMKREWEKEAGTSISASARRWDSGGYLLN